MKNESLYLIEKLAGENGEPYEWLVADANGEKWTSTFSEVPEAWKFPTLYHARVIWDEYIRVHGRFKDSRRRYQITEHGYFGESVPREREAIFFMDWEQVALNGGPPCFAVGVDGDPTRFCGRAEHWAGHGSHHEYISLAAFAGRFYRLMRHVESYLEYDPERLSIYNDITALSEALQAARGQGEWPLPDRQQEENK